MNKEELNELEEGAKLNLDFSKLKKVVSGSDDVIPVAVQNSETKEIILVAYTNQFAMEESFRTRIVTFWSTSRQELWIKGKTSGQYFELVEARVNCEQNSLVYLVRPKGAGICHTQNSEGDPRNCYYRTINFDDGSLTNTDS